MTNFVNSSIYIRLDKLIRLGEIQLAFFAPADIMQS